MGWYILGFLVLLGVFAAGFLVGAKHKEQAMAAVGTLKDTIGKL